MAIQAYYDWRDAGSPFTVARPIRELVAYARAHNVQILGVIGDRSHLTSNRPQDHTPFSVTAWPLPLPGYIVTATDLKQGDWCWKFLTQCKQGLRPWVKFVNFGFKQYHVRNDWQPVSNSDEHFHCSARTDHLNTPCGLDPWGASPNPVPAPQQPTHPAGKRSLMVEYVWFKREGTNVTWAIERPYHQNPDFQWEVLTGADADAQDHIARANGTVNDELSPTTFDRRAAKYGVTPTSK